MSETKTRRVLSIATLWPNEAQPRFGTFVARSLEALQRHTHWQPTVINPIGVPPLAIGRYSAQEKAAKDGIEHGISVHRPPFRLIPRIGARLTPSAIERAILPLARAMHASAPFDLVDAQFFWPDGPVAMRVADELGLPLSIKARGADIHYWGGRSHARRAMLEAAERASGLLAVGKALTSDMAKLGMPADKIRIHNTGLDRDLFRPLDHPGLRGRLAKQFAIPIVDDKPLLAGVGALIERKGHAFTIEALARLPEAQLLIVGKGEDEASLKTLVSRLGLSDRVHFLGSLDHAVLPLVLSAADAMVLPSRSEGLANAWIEALACGTPLVICDAGSAREVITGPEAGAIVPRTAEGVAEGIRLVLDTPHDPQRVAETVARFSWKANGEALAAYYDSLIAN